MWRHVLRRVLSSESTVHIWVSGRGLKWSILGPTLRNRPDFDPFWTPFGGSEAGRISRGHVVYTCIPSLPIWPLNGPWGYRDDDGVFTSAHEVVPPLEKGSKMDHFRDRFCRGTLKSTGFRPFWTPFGGSEAGRTSRVHMVYTCIPSLPIWPLNGPWGYRDDDGVFTSDHEVVFRV